ncbi:flagellar motor protein MotB [Paracoccus pacificus]|uniref:Flagellar motor protein MotB n=1 Tax=Paracoccus pacificus TaxID=1463598 RepID=A0ABW4R349_9RHOB
MAGMAHNGAKTPIIIRRGNEAEETAHHGGAWKVAYADFVTAMMAFFLLMWLLNATTEKQRQGLADYFNPTVVQHPNGQSGTDQFAGETPLSNQSDIATGTGGTPDTGANVNVSASMTQKAQADSFQERARHVQNQLTGSGAESMQRINLLRHVVTRMTDDGLVIELTDLTDAPLFDPDTSTPRPAMRELIAIVQRVLSHVPNDLAIQGHVRGYPEMMRDSPVWPLSDGRAHAVRKLLTEKGFPERRIQRVTGFADRRNRTGNPMDPANNRIELIMLR